MHLLAKPGHLGPPLGLSCVFSHVKVTCLYHPAIEIKWYLSGTQCQLSLPFTWKDSGELNILRVWCTGKKSLRKLLPISSGTNAKYLKMAAMTLKPQIWNHEITINGFFYYRKCGKDESKHWHRNLRYVYTYRHKHRLCKHRYQHVCYFVVYLITGH